MTYVDNVDILPSSIFEKGQDSNIRKLWKLFSEPLDDLENGIKYWYDKDNLSGLQLDKMGLLKGIPRNGMSDADYKYELDLPRTLNIVTLPAVYETLSAFGINPRVKELHTPFLFDIDRLNGNKVLDGTWNLYPAIEPVVLSKLDGNWLLDGNEPLEPIGVRKLALLVKIETSEAYPFAKMPSEIKNLLAGVTVYYQFLFSFNLGIDFSNLTFTLDGTWLLDGTRKLKTELEVIFYNGVTELYRVIPNQFFDRLEFSTLKRNYSITKFELWRSGELLLSKDISIEANVYLQYKFTVR